MMMLALNYCKRWWIWCLLILLPYQLFAQGTQFLDEEEQQQQAPTPQQLQQPTPNAQPQQSTLNTQTPNSNQLIDLIFLMDVSGSMERTLAGSDGMNKLDAAKAVLLGMIPELHEKIRFQLWTFSSKLQKFKNSSAIKPPQPNPIFEAIGPPDSIARNYLKSQIKQLRPPGDAALRTNLYAAVNETLFYFSSVLYRPPKDQKAVKVIVLLSDGQDDNLSPITLGIVMSTKIKFPDIDIRAIGYTISKDDPFFQVLCQIASKKQCVTANNWEQLKQMIQFFLR